ncbi:MAG: hypothetical protein ABFC12_06995 [Methanobacterium sp.]
MKKSYIILIIILIAAMVIGYFAYTQYNILKTQESIRASQELKDNATTYFDQAVDLENAGDHSGAITMYQKSIDNARRVLASDNHALSQASGVYHDYLDNEIRLLEKMIQLIEYKIYLNKILTNSLNTGQEKVEPGVLTPYIDNLTREVADLKEEENRIIRDNPDEFRFLNP